MPHADTSYFPPGLSKAEIYAQLIQQTRGLIDGQRNWVRHDTTPTTSQHRILKRQKGLTKDSNLANVASLLWHAYAVLPAPINWSGFYVRDDKFPSPTTTQSSNTTRTLLLGPFFGKPACQLIHFNRGVCGTAAARAKTVIVDDVLRFPGHIACDAESRSEIVVPIIVNRDTHSEPGAQDGDGEVVGLIDVDCTDVGGFNEVDGRFLGELAGVLASGCDW